MNQYELVNQYVRARAGTLAARAVHDERGAATAEVIVLVGAAVVGAAAVGVIIWNKMRAGANNIQTPAP